MKLSAFAIFHSIKVGSTLPKKVKESLNLVGALLAS